MGKICSRFLCDEFLLVYNIQPHLHTRWEAIPTFMLGALFGRVLCCPIFHSLFQSKSSLVEAEYSDSHRAGQSTPPSTE